MLNSLLDFCINYKREKRSTHRFYRIRLGWPMAGSPPVRKNGGKIGVQKPCFKFLSHVYGRGPQRPKTAQFLHTSNDPYASSLTQRNHLIPHRQTRDRLRLAPVSSFCRLGFRKNLSLILACSSQ